MLTASLIGPFIVMSLALTTTGCASPATPSEGRIALPANLIQPCPPLTDLEDAKGGTVLRKLIEVAEMYYDCAQSKQALIDAVQPGVTP